MPEGKINLVRKRDGRLAPFDQDKITNAIFKAAQSVGGDDRERAIFISDQVIKMLEERYGESVIPSVEDIQDLVERALIKHGHAKTAKAYILYRDLHNKLRDIRALVDANELVDGYLEHLDWRVNENSNMSFSLQGLNNHIFSAVNSAYWLNRLYPKHVRDAHIEWRHPHPRPLHPGRVLLWLGPARSAAARLWRRARQDRLQASQAFSRGLGPDRQLFLHHPG